LVVYLVYHCGSDDYGWSPIFWFTAMRDDSDFIVRTAVYGDMGRDNAQSLPRLQEETELGHFDLILHVGMSSSIHVMIIFFVIFIR
jgi:hypothetical protein